MAAKNAKQKEIQWMDAPQAPTGCPPGLEYLTQIDQLLVQQQVELLECSLPCIKIRLQFKAYFPLLRSVNRM